MIRRVFQAKLISEGERWIDMPGDRNRMSHTYDSDTFDTIIKADRRALSRALEGVANPAERRNQRAGGDEFGLKTHIDRCGIRICERGQSDYGCGSE